MTDEKVAEKPAELRPMDNVRLDLIARLSPQMAPIISALSYPDDRIPGEYPANSSAFETVNTTHPSLAQAISLYIRSRIHPGESFDKLIEDACRALFGLAPMTDADERAWMNRRDVKPTPTPVVEDGSLPIADDELARANQPHDPAPEPEPDEHPHGSRHGRKGSR